MIFNNNYKILTIGGGNHHNALGVIRALGRRGYPVELITIGNLHKHYISSSKYVSQYHALKDVKELSAYLLFRKKSPDKEVIISCADVVTEHLNRFANCLSNYYILPGNNIEGIMQSLMDKTTMIAMASKHGISAPTVWHLPTDYDQVTFPCITKVHVSSHGNKHDIVICKNRAELDIFLRNNYHKVFAQPYIQKKEEVQFIGCAINGGDEIIIPGMTKVLRSQPNTNTGFLEYGPVPTFYRQTVENVKAYIKDCHYSGLFSVEFIRDNQDKIWFLETNFRNDGNAFCVTEAGINLPVIWVKANRGEEYHSEIRSVRKIRMMPEFQDLKLVMQGAVSPLQWIKEWKSTDSFMEYAPDDKRPFFQYIFNKILP